MLAIHAAVDKGGPLLPSGGHCHQGASLWTAQLSPVQVGGTSRVLDATLPTPGLAFQPPYRLWWW